MKDTRWVHAYARATAAAAQAAGRLEAVAGELARWSQALASLPEWQTWRDGRMSRTARASAVRRLTEGRADPLVARLLARMAQWNHLALLPDVAAAVTDRHQRAAGRVRAQVRSAVPLPPAAAAPLQACGRRLAGARECALDVTLDPSLRAGFVLRMDDWEVDYSLSGRLRRLRRAWLTPMGRLAAASGSVPP